MQNKKSIRFYKDHEVRAIWDEEKSLWWFSIVDIVGAITDSPSPRKYWSVLKTRLKKAGNELTTRCSQLKMTAADGKQYATDCFVLTKCLTPCDHEVRAVWDEEKSKRI